MAKNNAGDKKEKHRNRDKSSTDKKRIKEKFTEMLELPKELVLDRPKLTMIGQRDLMIENYKAVLEYGIGRMRVKTGSGIVRITGTDLTIREITSEDIIISGTINTLEFIDAG